MDVAQRLNLATDLRDKADALVALCSQISGIRFDPDDDAVLSLDEWFTAALAALTYVAPAIESRRPVKGER